MGQVLVEVQVEGWWGSRRRRALVRLHNAPSGKNRLNVKVELSDSLKYRPIACELHDRLEALATRGRVVRITIREPDGATRMIDDRIVDVFARAGEEFVRTGAGELIRLDRLESVDGVEF